MGYLRGTPGIKRSTLLAITECESTSEYCNSTKDGMHLELKHTSSLNVNYLKQDFASLDPSSYVARRRMFEVDGNPLDHWKKNNFDFKRDTTCRVVYEPKTGGRFFRKTLRSEDYAITRGLTTSLEQPYFSKYNRFFPKKGHFCCKACGNQLYLSEAKFDVDDGWPAFGTCILGSIGVAPVEERKSQTEKKEQACIKIQAVVRRHQCRNRVEKMLNELIEELLRRKLGYDSSENGEHDDVFSEGYTSSEYSWSSSSDESENSERSNSSNGGYVLSRDFGDDYAEIHCHRCKSHLGDVIVQKNTGRNGEAYRERHRVNGRALKYMDEDLPKRTIGNSSLLFADVSQKRRFGLPNSQENEVMPLIFDTTHRLRKVSDPFSVRGSRKNAGLRLVDCNERNALLLSCGTKCSMHKILPDALSLSNHESAFRSDIRRKNSDPLSVSCHASLLQGNISHRTSSLAKKIKKFPTTQKSRIGATSCRRRPMRRGNTDSSFSIAERAVTLENLLLFLTPNP